jgi:hypothetical protein
VRRTTKKKKKGVSAARKREAAAAATVAALGERLEEAVAAMHVARAAAKHARDDAQRKSTLIAHLQSRLKEVTPAVSSPATPATPTAATRAPGTAPASLPRKVSGDSVCVCRRHCGWWRRLCDVCCVLCAVCCEL